MMSPVLAERFAVLDALVLKKGSHEDFNDGVCAMEAVAWLAGEPHSDQPGCVSPIIGVFLRRWNDDLNDVDRQILKPLLPTVIDTAGDGKDEQRAWMVADWLIRVHTPAWLELAGITDAAAALRALAPIVDMKSCEAAQPALNDATAKGAAARDAAWEAAWDAAWDAARVAAWDAAWDAAQSAAWDAAQSAAWDAAQSAAWSAARVAARDAAQSAAWAAARDALNPTKLELQASAVELVERIAAP